MLLCYHGNVAPRFEQENTMNRSVSHTGTLRVDAPPEHAFQLFTAPGERLWEPEVLRGGDGRHKGSVFVTDAHGDKAYWVVVDYDDAALHARYARIAPGSRAGTVAVRARDDGAGATEVEVTYELTALTDAGNEQLAAFDAEAYAQMLAEWESLIRDANLEYPLPFAADG
jgi:hypothetical protein